MPRDYFAILGLTPGVYGPEQIRRRFNSERTRCLGGLHESGTHEVSRQRLEELHLAYQTLANPEIQREYLAAADDSDAATRVRRLIQASLEDGLLRYSRRQEILDQGRALGFSEFQVHLMIAQVQFGDVAVSAAPPRRKPEGSLSPAAWRRLTAIGVLAVVMFFGVVRWLGWG